MARLPFVRFSEQAVVRADDRRAVLKVLDAMRDRVLVRRELDGWSYGAIAGRAGLAPLGPGLPAGVGGLAPRSSRRSETGP